METETSNLAHHKFYPTDDETIRQRCVVSVARPRPIIGKQSIAVGITVYRHRVMWKLPFTFYLSAYSRLYITQRADVSNSVGSRIQQTLNYELVTSRLSIFHEHRHKPTLRLCGLSVGPVSKRSCYPNSGCDHRDYRFVAERVDPTPRIAIANAIWQLTVGLTIE